MERERCLLHDCPSAGTSTTTPSTWPASACTSCSLTFAAVPCSCRCFWATRQHVFLQYDWYLSCTRDVRRMQCVSDLPTCVCVCACVRVRVCVPGYMFLSLSACHSFLGRVCANRPQSACAATRNSLGIVCFDLPPLHARGPPCQKRELPSHCQKWSRPERAESGTCHVCARAMLLQMPHQV